MNDENLNLQRPSRRRPREKETPFVTRLLTVQLICGAVIILILFLISKSGGTAYGNICSFYGEVKKTDMSVSEVISTFKSAAAETFAPVQDIQNTQPDSGESEPAPPDIF